MMASRFVGSALQGARNGFDVPLAALAGLSVAFIAFAAPADLLSQLVGSSGLPSLLPAAEPPVGMKARIGLGAAGAIAMFTIAFLVLRWLDRFGARRAEQADDAAMELEAPRLRRRDFHPDAAPRPPLLAGRDLGEPDAEPVRVAQVESEPKLVAELEPEPELAAELEPEPEPVAEPVQRAGESEAEAAPDQPKFLRRSWLPEAAAGAIPAETTAATEPAPVAEPQRPDSPPNPGSSIGDLLERLEQGLARRRAVPAMPSAGPAAPPETVPAAQVFPEPSDDRLRSAIDSLQRLASRQD